MKKNHPKYRIIFAGGGTGGHLFPAISVAEKIRELMPDAGILFVGTKDKIEARVVPQNGFDFKTIWISGLQRRITFKNLMFPLKMITAAIQSLVICIRFKPQVAIGTGAYVAGPVIWASSVMGAKIMLLEQNSYPGITNRLLEKSADEIHISFKDSEKYFRNKSKLKLTGNPIRVNEKVISKSEVLRTLGLDVSKKTLLILGGSLGAGSINNVIADNLNELMRDKNLQIIWQTGKNYYEELKKLNAENIKIMPFIDDMNTVYSCADLIIARAGATTIAEIAALALPVVFVPSPNVAENHQYKNAKSIQDDDGCVIIKDSEINDRLIFTIKELLINDEKRAQLAANIKKFSKPDAAQIIAERAIKLAEAN